jgi:hypothetical protein
MIPFLPEGQYSLIAKWRKSGEGDDKWNDGGQYPIRVIYDHIQVPVTVSTT